VLLGKGGSKTPPKKITKNSMSQGEGAALKNVYIGVSKIIRFFPLNIFDKT
jgi:hypothetical protein